MATFRPDILFAAVFMAGSAAAQISPPIPQKSVKVERITRAAGGVGLYEVGPDGTVAIDWRAVEAMAKAPNRDDYPMALMMLAIRDGTWKPIPETKP